MKSLFLLPLALALTASLFAAPARAQKPAAPTAASECPGPVYKSGEVTRRARITSRPDPGLAEEAHANQVQGTVQLTAVLCRTGRVTDIKVTRGLPHGMTEKAVEAARLMKFEPATKGGRRVSQTITLEYQFSLGGGPGEGPEGWARHAGRVVEELQVEGNRRLTDAEVLRYVRTRPGDAFDEAAVRRDLQNLLRLGTLDPAQTRVSTGAGARGGVVVIFTVAELPVIRSLAFKGLESVAESEVVAALAGRQPGVRREGVYDPAHVAAARRAILELLAARGRPRASVEVEVAELSAVSVELTFVVKEGPPARKETSPGRWF